MCLLEHFGPPLSAPLVLLLLPRSHDTSMDTRSSRVEDEVLVLLWLRVWLLVRGRVPGKLPRIWSCLYQSLTVLLKGVSNCVASPPNCLPFRPAKLCNVWGLDGGFTCLSVVSTAPFGFACICTDLVLCVPIRNLRYSSWHFNSTSGRAASRELNIVHHLPWFVRVWRTDFLKRGRAEVGLAPPRDMRLEFMEWLGYGYTWSIRRVLLFWVL